MANQLNSGSLDTLKIGQTVLTKVTRVKGSKVQMEIAERIQNPNAVSGLGDGFENALGMMNASDDRFSAGKPRRHWPAVEALDLEVMLNIEGLDLENGEYKIETVETENVPKEVETMELNNLNPTAYVNPATGEEIEKRMRLRIVETTEGTEWDKAHPETKAKKRGKGGDFILHNGNYIFNRNQILFADNLGDDVKVPHVFLAPDTVSVTSKVESGEQTVVESVDLTDVDANISMI